MAVSPSLNGAGWTMRGWRGELLVEPDGAAVLVSGERRVVIFRRIDLSPGATIGEAALRLRGRFERLGAAAFTLERPHTRVFLRWLDVSGQTLGYGGVTRFGGQFRTRRFETVTVPPPGTTAAELTVVAHSPGGRRLDAISLDRVRPSMSYTPVRAALILGWALVAGAIVGSLVRRARGRSALLLGGVLAVLVTGVALSQSGVAAAVVPLTTALAAWLPGVATPSAGLLLEGGHVLGFGVLVFALLTVRSALGLNVFGVLVLGFLLALATEALQRHRPDRAPELGDIGVDAIGLSLGLLAWAAFALRSRRRRAGLAPAQAAIGGGGRR